MCNLLHNNFNFVHFFTVNEKILCYKISRDYSQKSNPCLSVIPNNDLVINHLASNNFFCPVANVVHGAHPRHWIMSFQFFGNVFCRFHLIDEAVHPLLCLLIQVSQICPELAGQNQFVVQGWMILRQIVFVYPSPNPNRASFFR